MVADNKGNVEVKTNKDTVLDSNILLNTKSKDEEKKKEQKKEEDNNEQSKSNNKTNSKDESIKHKDKKEVQRSKTEDKKSNSDKKDNKSKPVDNKDKPVIISSNGLAPLKIRTYDGSSQLTHPKVLHFKSGWNGWKYWMAFTPYPFGNDDYENPSIVVSQNGYDWVTPKGLKNPLTGVPKDVDRGGHYSDPHILTNGSSMELWYRYNPAREKGSGSNNGINMIFRVKSKDGVNWSKPELVFNDKNTYLSPVIIYEENKYKTWFTNYSGDMKYRESSDGKSWTDAKLVNIELPGYNPWHQDIIKTDLGYELVFCAYPKGKFNQNIQQLYYARSKNGIDFEKPMKILSPSKDDNKLDNKMIYRSSILKVDGVYKIYYSAMDRKTRWHVFLTEGSDLNKLKGF